jgi:hypothetical protein
MGKDAKGHGSAARGGRQTKMTAMRFEHAARTGVLGSKFKSKAVRSGKQAKMTKLRSSFRFNAALKSPRSK